MSDSLVQRLGQLAFDVGRGPLAGEARDATWRLVRHGLSATLEGCAFPAAQVARSAVDGTGRCTVYGSSRRASAAEAAFANAASGHSALLEDSGPGGRLEGSHPGSYVLPAAWAVAEEQGASGERLLAAVLAGYEVASRMGRLCPPAIFERGLRAVCVIGPFGAAAAAGVLLGASARQLAAAFAVAANRSAGLNQGFLEGSMEPLLQPGFAARDGVIAARLAMVGLAAAPRMLEGERGFFATLAGGAAAEDGLGLAAEPAVLRVGAKRYATCLYNQGTLDLIERLPAGLPQGPIRQVVLHRAQGGANGLMAPAVDAAPPYDSSLAMQMSARFTAAAALLGRPVRSGRYYLGAEADRPVHALAARIELRRREQPGVLLEVHLDSGEVRRAESTATAAPLEFSGEAVRSVFLGRARDVLGPRAAEVTALVDGLPQLPDIRPLQDLLRSGLAVFEESA